MCIAWPEAKSQAKPNQKKPGQAKAVVMALNWLWPGLQCSKAKAVGPGRGFSLKIHATVAVITYIFLLQFSVNAPCYPIWGSLAWNYLVIMAPSVLSEWVFSSAVITISKCQVCLKIVEVLQCVKCALQHDPLFQEPEASSAVQEILKGGDTKGSVDEKPVWEPTVAHWWWK